MLNLFCDTFCVDLFFVAWLRCRKKVTTKYLPWLQFEFSFCSFFWRAATTWKIVCILKKKCCKTSTQQSWMVVLTCLSLNKLQPLLKNALFSSFSRAVTQTVSSSSEERKKTFSWRCKGEERKPNKKPEDIASERSKWSIT